MDQQCIQLAVSVDNLLRVQIVESVNYLDEHFFCLLLRQTPSHLLQQLLQTPTIRQLLHLVEVHLLTVHELDVLHHMWTIQLLHYLQFCADGSPTLLV